MFQRVLIANRGEIAVRIARTLQELGMTTVAVFSDADRDALHVRMADEAYPIGPAPSAESYLRVDRLVDGARRARVDAVHPGYGFLSENPAFARAVADAGVTFIGPPPEAMEAMGYKTAARDAMVRAGVPVVPGATVESPDELPRAAERLGFPILVKASAGGGGKGMRLVRSADELAAGWERARSEAQAAFGDATVYLEKAIQEPRHVEIQVLADAHGHVVHLHERDCSIQRRHQKVVEESPTPSPVRTDDLIARMGEVAVRAAQAVGYVSAGTVEFLLDARGDFYFLEMNTRLQVEHPITELRTGIDLVAEMVRIAAGEELGYGQEAIAPRGHAIECRVYAEDPATGFLPSPGRIEVLRTPAGPGVRDDAGTYEGAEVSSFYDPLLSKLCVWAPTRERAVDRMRRALSEYVVTGIRTNLPFHLALMGEPHFRSGRYDTGFIDAHPELLTPPTPASARDALVLGAAVSQALREEARRAAAARAAPAVRAGPSPWRLAARSRM
ncbi:MAG: acetyl/propionyl/methylcrotonyl-CoA carboxylase subunit alpha [Sandaracinaceae bacterium]